MSRSFFLPITVRGAGGGGGRGGKRRQSWTKRANSHSRPSKQTSYSGKAAHASNEEETLTRWEFPIIFLPIYLIANGMRSLAVATLQQHCSFLFSVPLKTPPTSNLSRSDQYARSLELNYPFLQCFCYFYKCYNNKSLSL